MYTRHLTHRLLESLDSAPVVLLQGARQSGKSTLVQSVISKQHDTQYVTLDDADNLVAATSAPQTFIKTLKAPVAIDEVQLAPEIFRAIKLMVDRKRQPGMFFLTGSANVMLLPRLSESLVGRLQILTLWPLSQSEIEGARETFIPAVFKGVFKTTKLAHSNDAGQILQRMTRGGFPEPVQMKSTRVRSSWFNSYITTVLQRDVRELANIDRLTLVPNLLKLLAARTGGLLNVLDLASAAGIPNSTLTRYLTVLEATYLVVFLKPWSPRISTRLTKSKKIYLSDTGLLAHLLGIEEDSLPQRRPDFGHLLENFVLLELLKQASWNDLDIELFHFRTHKGVEVDFVLETRAGRVVGIEVKSSSTVQPSDLRGLNLLEQIAGKNFVSGIILYTGDRVYPLASNKWAIPISALWSGGLR